MSLMDERPHIGSTASVTGPASYTNPDPDGDGIAYNGKPVYTLEEAAHQLNRGGDHWEFSGKRIITYNFLDSAPGGQYNNPHTGLGGDVEGFSPFTPAQRAAAREAIALWDDLINVSFVEKNGKGADLQLMNTTTGPAQAAAYTPFYEGEHGRYAKIQGDVFINNAEPSNFDLGYGGYGWTSLVHELGHTVGLLHPGDYNYGDDSDGDGVPDPITYSDAFYFQDSMQYTIMSYFLPYETGMTAVNWNAGVYMTPQTPMLHDVAAVQAIYGADMTTRAGDTTYGFHSTANRTVFDFTINKAPFLTIWDGGGHDTLDFSGFTYNTVLDLNEGHFSSGHSITARPAAELNAMYGVNFNQAFWDAYIQNNSLADNISIAYGAVIEDGIGGSGRDRIYGNAVDNRLTGGLGADTITGGLGRDTFVFNVADNGDQITDFATGVDRIDLSIIDADTGHGGNQAFHYIGSAAFTGHAGELRVYTSGTNTIVAGDVNGDGVADLAFALNGNAAIAVSDFVL